MSGRLRSPHRHPFGRSRDRHQGEHAGNEAQDRIEPRQEIVQPNKPGRSHARSVALSDGRDNLGCVKRAFGRIEGTGATSSLRAKRSNPASFAATRKLDCFVAPLLAMRGKDIRSHSHDAISSEVCIFIVPLLCRGRRESRALTAPASPCAKSATENAHGFDRYSRDLPAFPAQWLYGLLRALPGERRFLPPLLTGLTANVTPRSRRQDHTTSPYAAAFSSARLAPR
jgi:hypothetical protein